MSPVMRQQFASLESAGAFVYGVLLDRLKMTSRPLSRNALAISAVSGSSFGFQSYFK